MWIATIHRAAACQRARRQPPTRSGRRDASHVPQPGNAAPRTSDGDAPVPVPELQSIADTGAVPVVSWGCGAKTRRSTTGSRTPTSGQMSRRCGHSVHPCSSRYVWEMNLEGPQRVAILRRRPTDRPASDACMETHPPHLPRDGGADNVAFVWCPGISRSRQLGLPYFPGADAVDWIGIDGYVRDPDPAAAATAFPEAVWCLLRPVRRRGEALHGRRNRRPPRERRPSTCRASWCSSPRRIRR